MRADVPVGSYLSGELGLDHLRACRPHGSGRSRDFSVTFDSAEHDESEFQLEMARALGTQHSAVACREGDIAAVFPR